MLKKYYQHKLLAPLRTVYFLMSDYWMKNKLFAVERAYLSKKENKQLISFSLYGSDPRYFQNIDTCISSYNELFPDWEIRLYLSSDVSISIVEQLKKFGCEIVIMKCRGTDNRYMYWRFLALDDKSVSIVLIRDIDSIASFREKKMVSDWLISGKTMHIIRDHLLHNAKIMGGMWGMVVNKTPYGIEKEMHKFTKKDRYGSDQLFLEKLYNRHTNDMYVNDVIHRFANEKPVIIPNENSDFHIGQINLKF